MQIKNWHLDYEEHQGLCCQAPCTLYSVLYEKGIIPDPFYGLNDAALTKLAERGCRFFAEFEADEALLAHEYVELTFYGLDTLCNIFLNGSKLGAVKNMHRSYTYDVKPLLRIGKNTLSLEFQSPIEYFTQKQARHYLYTNDGDTIPGAAHLRKALYQSGWDWGPALPDMGIFRPVELDAYNGDKIQAVMISQQHQNGQVKVQIQVETRHDRGCSLYAKLDGQQIQLKDGCGEVLVKEPRLWWARGYGDQNLYPLEVELVQNDTVLDQTTRQIGLRTLTVSTQTDPDKKGSEFCFVLNGIKIFSMGANYIPQDNLITRITHDRMDEMMQQCLDANFNTLRVWGGGYYPDDYFFELCDKNGILVWQDFMVACINVWMTSEFEAECAAEATENLKRIQHHASLALFAGNNEMEYFVGETDIGRSELVRADYLRLYEHVLPEICEKVAPDTFYWPSSPSSGGGFDQPDSESRGDVHYWAVWHGGLPFTDYRQHNFRFCSEYGFESFPSIKTVRTFCEEKDMNCFSRVMEEHQKCKGGNGKILRYLADNYLYPHSFEKLVYASQLLQADAIKYGVEHFRRQRGRCMGSIYWQFNDCWPVASWSSVDSLGRYKALHYAAKKFYAPVAMGLFLEYGTLAVNVANETRQDFKGRIHLALCRSDFTPLWEQELSAEVPALSAKDVFTRVVETDDPYTTYLYADLYNEAGEFIMRQTELFVAPKYFSWEKPELTVKCTDSTEGVVISVQADRFTKGVEIDFESFDCILSDNFFALAKDAPYCVTARTKRSAAELEKEITLKTVYDIR